MAVVEKVLRATSLTDLRSDKALIRAAQQGNTEAASALFQRYYSRIYRFVLHLTHGRSNAEDLTQEAFTRAIGALSRFNGEYKFEHWLLRIAKNLCIDEARKDVHRPEPTDPHELPELPALGGADFVWESVSAQLATSIVHDALARLPVRQRSVLVLRELEGMSYADIASIVGTNERGVEATLRRARARFRLEVAKAESDEEERAVCRRTLRLFARDAEEALASSEASRHLRRCFRCRAKVKAINGADKLLGIIAIPVAIPKLSWPLHAVASLRARGSRMIEHVRGSGEGFVAQVAPFTVSAMLVASMAAAQVVGPVRATSVQDNPVMNVVIPQEAADETDTIPSIVAGGTAPMSRRRSIPATSGAGTPAPSSSSVGSVNDLLGLDLSDLPVLRNLDTLEELERALNDPAGAVQGAVSDVTETADAVVETVEQTVETVADSTTATEGVDVPEVRTSRITSRIAPE